MATSLSLPLAARNHEVASNATSAPPPAMRSFASTPILPSIVPTSPSRKELSTDVAPRDATAPLHRRGSYSPSTDATNSRAQSPSPQPVARSSRWIDQYKSQAKSEFIDHDLTAMLRRFEDLSVPPRARKPLNSSLLSKHATSTTFAGLADDDSDLDRAGSVGFVVDDGNSEHLRSGDGVVSIPGLGAARLRRQATKLLIQRRAQTLTAAEQLKRQQLAAKVVPKRFLFDATRWRRSCRCDYCQLAGGDLECATCDVVAHARCYLSAYESSTRKSKGAFVVPTRFSWLCQHCQRSLQLEYDASAQQARRDYIANQKAVFGKVVKAYVRMTRDALTFKKKKDAIIRIQAIMRGRLARVRFHKLQRMRLKPYALDGVRIQGFRRGVHEGTGEELRLANGFTCNPYVYVTVVDGADDDAQLFCFETPVKKGVSLLDHDVAFKHDPLFVPGVNGNVTFCFTLLSKNGPNNFVIGQSVLRLRDTDSLWREGGHVELPVVQELEIFPRTAQRQTLRLADANSNTTTSTASTAAGGGAGDAVFANGSSSALALSVAVAPCSEVHSHCGYLLTKNTLESFQSSQRWCVLADGVLRIYRHYGVTLATETVEMAHTIELKVVETRTGNRQDQWIAMEHLTRLYIFQCEKNKAGTRMWLKKLQQATRYDAAASAARGEAVNDN